jgi:methyl-accepting chemotaxis protein
MKRPFAPLVLISAVFFLLSGCTTTGFLGFLATTDSVDVRMAEQDARMKEEMELQRAQMDKMARDVKEMQDLRDSAAKAVEQTADARRSVEELKSLIAELEAKIGDLPEQTIRRIIALLQSSLPETEREKK